LGLLDSGTSLIGEAIDGVSAAFASRQRERLLDRVKVRERLLDRVKVRERLLDRVKVRERLGVGCLRYDLSGRA